MHVPGSRLGEYRTRWTFTDSVCMNLATVFIRLKKRKKRRYNPFLVYCRELAPGILLV